MTKMTATEKQEFLADLHVGVLGLNDPGRGPLTVPIWYDYTPGGLMWVLTDAKSRKGKLIEVGTRLSLAAQTETLPYVYVSVEGVVKSVEPSDYAKIKHMATRYLGEEQGKTYADADDLTHQLVVSVEIERWLAVDYSKLS